MILVSYMKQGKQEGEASQLQVIKNATSLITAGTETTVSLMCGAVYHILSNPPVLLSLCQEIRGAADNASDLNLELIYGMKYLRACLDETMRMYPSIVGTLPRVVDGDGAYICDQFVPPNTVVGVNQWATYRSNKNFIYPDEFRPDRWLNVEEGEYIGDRRKAFQPFGYGPRKCIANE
jgi:cytochrome P450